VKIINYISVLLIIIQINGMIIAILIHYIILLGGMRMKKLEIIIRAEKMESLKQALDEIGIKGMTVVAVMGCGNQKGRLEIYRGTEITLNLLHKLKIEIVIADDLVDKVVKKTRDVVGTGKVGDGKIFIFNVENAIRIRTGEEGDAAI